jgi:hypothetical protein
MRVACSPGIATLLRSALGNLAAPAFAPAGAHVIAGPGQNGSAVERAVIMRGGPILTVDPERPAAEALAIRGPRILAVGTATEVKRHFTRATEILDLEGRAVLPGFVDSHAHVLASALADLHVADAGELLAAEPDFVAARCAATLREFAARGCTTVYDPAVGRLGGAAEHALLAALAALPDAPLRVRGAFIPELAAELAARPGSGSGPYEVCGISLWVDGAVHERAAALEQPYLGEGGHGRLNHSDEALREAICAWRRAGWQLVLHAHGDRASEQVLRCLEASGAAASPAVADHRLERCTLAGDGQAARAAALGLSLSHTISDVYFHGERFRDELLGSERAARVHALRRDLDYGLRSSCHSDAHGASVDPLLCLRTATTRVMRDSDDVLGPFQQLDLAQALPMVTYNPAHQVGLGDRVGMLRAGMLADLVVLDRDPREIAPERLHELKVLETWLAGRRQRWV